MTPSIAYDHFAASKRGSVESDSIILPLYNPKEAYCRTVLQDTQQPHGNEKYEQIETNETATATSEELLIGSRKSSIVAELIDSTDNTNGFCVSLNSDPLPPQDVIICVVGVGYVGESLLRAFGQTFHSIGYDVDSGRVEALRRQFKSLPNVELTTDESLMSTATHYLISVPTLLREDKSIDTSHLMKAIAKVADHARPGCTVVIESSVCVGMTRLVLGQYADLLHCGMSPERVDPGRTKPSLQEIPKVISGLDETALRKIEAVYSKVFDRLVLVSSPEVAEMAKLYENCYRMINIAYVNEIADACRGHNIDVNEVVDAASTKPFGFQAFRPGLGVGGHCIPVNPFYLLINNSLPLLQQATSQMWSRPAKVATKIYDAQLTKRPERLPRILVVGVGFKPGQGVISCSPALQLASTFNDLGCESLMYFDELVEQWKAPWLKKMESKYWDERHLDSEFDLILVCVKQLGVDFDVLERVQRAEIGYF